MKIHLRLQAQIRQAVGYPRLEIEVPPASTVTDAVRALAHTHPERLNRILLTATGAVQPTLLLFRGDEQVEATAVLVEGDELTLLAPMAGG